MRLSKEECLAALNDLAAKHPNQPISRDFFRQRTFGNISEKDIAFHFGNFASFKQQAGLSPSRDEKKVLSEKIKECSVEKLREFNKTKWNWNDLYVKSKEGRFHSFLVVCDIHDISCDPFYRRMTIEAAKQIQVDHVVFNGDIYDHPEISTFRQRAIDYKPIERYKWVNSYFKDLRDVVPDAEMNFVEGNHEFRLIKHLVDKSSYVMDILDLQGYDARKFLGLDEFEINYHSRADFGTFSENDIQKEVKRNYYKFRDIVLFHHYPNEGSRFCMPGVSGHHHRFQAWPQFNNEFGSYTWYQSGGGSRRHVDYQVMMGEQWNNGFMIVIVDTENKKNTMFNYVDTTSEFCYLNGVLFKRTETESSFIR
jgi:hypothetical protein